MAIKPAKEFGSYRGGDAVKIVALSASAFKEQQHNMLKAGCDKVLRKPVQSTEIFAVLVKLLNVKFVYQQQTATAAETVSELNAKMLHRLLPAELIQKLHEAALNLDIEATEIIVEKIRQTAPEIAERLQKLADGYQFEQITQISESD
jgi:CheY-like chemotaxis protein